MRGVMHGLLDGVSFQEFEKARDAVVVDVGDAPVTVNGDQVEADRLVATGVVEVENQARSTCRSERSRNTRLCRCTS
jgi:hypothetical protein